MTQQRIRVAIIVHGGIGTGEHAQGFPALERLVNGLSDEFEITVYSQWKFNPLYKNEGIGLRSPSSSVSTGIIRWILLSALVIRDHRKGPFQLIFSFWGYPAGLITVGLSKLLGTKSGICLMGSDSASVPQIGFGILHRLIPSRLAKWAYSHASLLLAMSRWQVKVLRAFGFDMPVTVVPWGADRRLFHRRSARIADGTLHLLYVAHLSPVKDPSTMVRAFALIHEDRPSVLHVIGEDLMKGRIQHLCKELAIADRITFGGLVAYNQMPAKYQWADVLLVTSLSEGYAMAVAEAAASGVLIAGTNVGLVSDFGEQMAVIAEPGDHKSLARNLLKALDDPEGYAHRITKAYEWAELHDLDYTIKSYKTLFQELTLR